MHECRSAFELAAWPFWVMLLALAASAIARGAQPGVAVQIAGTGPALAIVGIAALVATASVVYRWRDHGVHSPVCHCADRVTDGPCVAQGRLDAEVVHGSAVLRPGARTTSSATVEHSGRPA
jgi:hypothetical protein